LIRNYRILRSQRLAEKGRYGEAERIVLKLVEEVPSSVAYNVFLADILLFSGNAEAALARFALSKGILDDKADISPKNRRFLAAYVNFRTTAIRFRMAGEDFPNWREFSKPVRDLEADRSLKNLFRLPE